MINIGGKIVEEFLKKCRRLKKNVEELKIESFELS